MIDISTQNHENNQYLAKYLKNTDIYTTYFIDRSNNEIDSIVGIKHLVWDSGIFNKKIGLLELNYGTLSNSILSVVNEFCLKEQYDCLFAKVSTKAYSTMHILENQGYNLMDSIVTLKVNIKNKPEIDIGRDYKSRLLKEKDLKDILNISDNLYEFGRFFEDNNLKNEDVNSLYKKWITNEVKNKDIDVVGIDYKNKLVGFISCRYRASLKDDRTDGVISLVGIDKSYQGLGIGKKLMNCVLSNFYKKRVEDIFVGTQIDNINALNFYISSGFRIESSSNSFHKWMK